jgi:hypothetical protein
MLNAPALGEIETWLFKPFDSAGRNHFRQPALRAKLTSGSWARRHALLAAIDHCDDIGRHAESLAEDFVKFRFSHFMEKWCGRRPYGTYAAFVRLGERSASGPGDYLAVLDVLADGGPGRLLSQDWNVSFEHFRQRRRLPVWMRGMTTPYPDMLPEDFAAMIGEIAEEALASGRRTRQQLCHDVPHIHHATSHIKAWAGLENAFPIPFWTGGKGLRPILCEKDLRLESRRFENCAHRRADDYESGARTLFVWDGPPPVMVSVMFVGNRPFIREMSGVHNAPVDAATARQIIEEVADARRV